MDKRNNKVDITSIEFSEFLKDLSYDEIMYLKNKVDMFVKIRSDNGECFNSDRVLSALVQPATLFLNEVFCKDGLKMHSIIKLINDRTNNLSKKWNDRDLYDLNNVNRPYMFELINLEERDILSVRGIAKFFFNKFMIHLNSYGFSLNMGFVELDYKKLFMYAKDGGCYKLSVSDSEFNLK